MNATASKRAPSKQLPQQQKSSDNRDELIIQHLHLVTAIAAHIQKSVPVHLELDDLIHAGTMGLFDAASKYDTHKEVAFPVYAKHRIRGAILDSLRQMDWASRDLRKRYRQVEAIKRELTEKLNREPLDTEIAEVMGLDARRWQALMIDFRGLALAATQVRVEREEQPIPETPSAPTSGPDQEFAKSELRERLQSIIQTLPERYQQVVRLYYERDLTMKEIGGILGVNESRVSQIHKIALELMHSALDRHGIRSVAAF